jgi:hypothetical protein
VFKISSIPLNKDMDTLTKNREQIIESIKTLPEDSLTELINFVDYLRYKATEKQSQKTSKNFLLSIAALGNSVKKSDNGKY